MNENDQAEVVEASVDNTEVETEVEVKAEKPVETVEAKVARLKRQLKKAQNELGVESETETKAVRKSIELDYGQKAYLIANGVKGSSEFNLVKEIMTDTGKPLEEVVDSRYFQTRLKEERSLANSKAASDAATGSMKGSPSARDTTEYWLAKGELPPTHMTTLRREVVNARMKQEADTGHFTDTPVVQ